MKFLRGCILFYIGGTAYMILEFLWRGRSHGTRDRARGERLLPRRVRRGGGVLGICREGFPLRGGDGQPRHVALRAGRGGVASAI